MKKLLFILSLLLFQANNTFGQTLRYDKPADFFEETLVIGNGTIGGIIYGGIKTDRIGLNDITLWTGEPCNMKIYSPDAHKSIPAIREALKEGDYRKADHLQHDVQGRFTQNYQPLGELQIHYLDSDIPVSNYVRTLDIDSAKATTAYDRLGYHYTSEYIASHPDSCIVIRLMTDNPAGIHAKIGLTCQVKNDIRYHGNTITNDGYVGYTSLPSYYDGSGGFAYDKHRAIHFRTNIQVSAPSAKAESDGILVNGDQTVLIYIVNATSFNGFDKDPVTEGQPYQSISDKRLSHASSVNYDDLVERHTKDYQSIYHRVSLRLDSKGSVDNRCTDKMLREYLDEGIYNPYLEALYFQYGRYLLISSSRTPNVPANLQGLWNEHMLPPWSCNYTSNINVEENYWHAETGAMPEMHESFLTFIKELQKSGEQTAKAYYGVENGWCLGHNTDIWATTNPVGLRTGDPCWANWNMGGAWVSTHIWEHYTFSMDKGFLREYYPILKGAAEFCMKWMVTTSSMGVEGKEYLITAPSTSPENFFIAPDGYHGRSCYGGFADLAMIRECVSDARDAAVELGIDNDFVKAANETLSRLQPYKIGKKGNLQEWFHDWEDVDPHHRHQSHLFGIYPGHNLDDGLNSKEAIHKAASKTLEIRGDRTTGWSTGWRVNLYARLHDAKNSYHMYRKLLSYVSPDGYKGKDARRGGGTYPNLLDAHSPFQIDGNFGGCAGVMEMLVQSEYKVERKKSNISIELLPALPSNWKDGSLEGVRARGGLSISMEWSDSKVNSLTIEAQKASTIMLKMNGEEKEVKLKKGKNYL